MSDRMKVVVQSFWWGGRNVQADQRATVAAFLRDARINGVPGISLMGWRGLQEEAQRWPGVGSGT